jgi:hypothetical protein
MVNRHVKPLPQPGAKDLSAARDLDARSTVALDAMTRQR